MILLSVVFSRGSFLLTDNSDCVGYLCGISNSDGTLLLLLCQEKEE